MKLQNMTVIFSIIIIPITLILSAYIGTQIDIAVLQQRYDTALLDATHDSVVAFELNTMNNNYSSNADSIRRDIKATINTFFSSLAIGLGISGASSTQIIPYIPAIVFTMYDGYYIYSPHEYIDEQGNTGYRHILKPYIYYATRYVNGSTDIVVNYSLDNYITIYGYVNGTQYISKSGYLIDINRVQISDNEVILDNNIKIQKENLKENIAIKDSNNNIVYKEYPYKYVNNKKVYKEADGRFFMLNNLEKIYTTIQEGDEDDSAIKYYKEAYNFSRWLKSQPEIINTVIPKNAIKSDNISKYDEFQNDNRRILDISSNNNPELAFSNFTQHKREIMKISIQENLNNAIAVYNKHSAALGTNSNFQLPILKETDWEKILTNVNIVSFMQGMPVATKIYNNYAIATSTNNKQYISPTGINFVDNQNTYHKPNCPILKTNINNGANIQAYKKVDFTKHRIDGDNKIHYYYKHSEYGCYQCIINSLNEELEISNLDIKIKRIYYQSLARERYNLDRVTKMLEDK